MAQRSLRFGIHDGAGHRAATWKLWTETAGGKADVYLACRALGGFLKASLHESGNWHIAYSKRAYEEYVKGVIPKFTDRFLEKWPRPTEMSPGLILAYRIITPSSAVTSTIEENKMKGVMWLPNAPESMATEIDIFIVTSKKPIVGWPGKRGMNTSLVGSLGLESGESVWVVHHTVRVPDLSKFNNRPGYFFKGKSRNDLEDGDLRMLVYGSAKDGSRVMYDCAAQKGE